VLTLSLKAKEVLNNAKVDFTLNKVMCIPGKVAQITTKDALRMVKVIGGMVKAHKKWL